MIIQDIEAFKAEMRRLAGKVKNGTATQADKDELLVRVVAYLFDK